MAVRNDEGVGENYDPSELLRQHRLKASDVQLLKRVGAGAYGEVKVCV